MNALISGSPPVPDRRGAASGARRLASLGLGAVLVATQCLGSWAHAQEEDVRPPTIRFDPTTVKQPRPGGPPVDVEAIVTDEESGVAGVRLNLSIGDDAMESIGDDRYRGELSAEGMEPGQEIKYWITATDKADNEQSRGFEFDPFVVTVGEPASTSTDPAIEASGTNWLVVGLAVLSAGALAALAGGGGGGSDASSAAADDPPLDLCCTILVE